jgi:hypothetical protein
MIFEIFSLKNSTKIGALGSKYRTNYHDIGFQEKRQFFCLKSCCWKTLMLRLIRTDWPSWTSLHVGALLIARAKQKLLSSFRSGPSYVPYKRQIMIFSIQLILNVRVTCPNKNLKHLQFFFNAVHDSYTLGNFSQTHLGSMIWCQFSAIFYNFWPKNWRFSHKPMLWSAFCIF